MADGSGEAGKIQQRGFVMTVFKKHAFNKPIWAI